jgi:hypothetical protein
MSLSVTSHISGGGGGGKGGGVKEQRVQRGRGVPGLEELEVGEVREAVKSHDRRDKLREVLEISLLERDMATATETATKRDSSSRRKRREKEDKQVNGREKRGGKRERRWGERYLIEESSSESLQEKTERLLRAKEELVRDERLSSGESWGERL